MTRSGGMTVQEENDMGEPGVAGSGSALTVKGFLEEVVPALSAAGWPQARIRAMSDETSRRMGAGGSTKEWILSMGTVVAESGDEIAMRAFSLAMEQWSAIPMERLLYGNHAVKDEALARYTECGIWLGVMDRSKYAKRGTPTCQRCLAAIAGEAR